MTNVHRIEGAAMPTRDSAPVGSPCWTDLWTSDVEGSRRFYGDLFGWEAEEPSPEFGGYFMFTRNGVPTAGAMGEMGDMPATNTWKVYLDTDDLAKTLEAAQAEGAEAKELPARQRTRTWLGVTVHQSRLRTRRRVAG